MVLTATIKSSQQLLVNLMLLVVIFGVLLIANWFITETLVLLPINLVFRFTSFGLWGLALLTVLFFVWCIGED